MTLTVNSVAAAIPSSNTTVRKQTSKEDVNVWNEYNDDAARMRAHNIEHGEAGIARAKEIGHDEFDIQMQTNSRGEKTGMLTITLKEDITLAKVKAYLGIPDGILIGYNQEKIEKLGTEEIGETGVYTHDLVKAPKGMKFTIPGGSLNPQQTVWQKICEFFANLF